MAKPGHLQMHSRGFNPTIPVLKRHKIWNLNVCSPTFRIILMCDVSGMTSDQRRHVSLMLHAAHTLTATSTQSRTDVDLMDRKRR